MGEQFSIIDKSILPKNLEAIYGKFTKLCDQLEACVQEFHDTLSDGDERPLHILVKNKCDRINPKLTELARKKDYVAASYNEDDCYLNHESTPHTVSIIRLSQDKYLLADGSIAQHRGSEDELILLAVGEADNILGFLQRFYGGSWASFTQKENDSLVAFDLTATELPDSVKVLEGFNPLTSEEIDQLSLVNALTAISQGKDYHPKWRKDLIDSGLVERNGLDFKLTETGQVKLNEIKPSSI